VFVIQFWKCFVFGTALIVFFSTNATVVIVCVEIYVVLCSGAFKIRGASNSIFALDDEQASKGVVTHSRFGASFNVLFAIFPDIGRTEWY